jgi:hypothetical protein
MMRRRARAGSGNTHLTPLPVAAARRRIPAVVAALLLVAVALAGCIQDELGPERTGEAGNGAAGTNGGQGLQSMPLRFTADAPAAIGIQEQIGIKNYPKYYGTIQRVIKNEGLFLHHAIVRPGKRDDRSLRRKRPRRPARSQVVLKSR